MKSKMQKFSGAKKKTAATKRTKDFKKVQEKRKKKKETDDFEIDALSTRLWPPFGHPKEVKFLWQYLFMFYSWS